MKTTKNRICAGVLFAIVCAITRLSAGDYDGSWLATYFFAKWHDGQDAWNGATYQQLQNDDDTYVVQIAGIYPDDAIISNDEAAARVEYYSNNPDWSS